MYEAFKELYEGCRQVMGSCRYMYMYVQCHMDRELYVGSRVSNKRRPLGLGTLEFPTTGVL